MERMLELPERERARAIRQLPPHVRAAVPYEWSLWGRPEQVWAPGSELWTVYECGRGWGKSRVVVEAAKLVALEPELCGGKGGTGRDAGEGGIIGIGGRTSGDTRENLLFGPSGLITNSPPGFRPEYMPGRARLVWPNGVVGRLFSGDEPRTFLGANVGFLLLDEFAHWANVGESIPMFELTLRHGERPRGVISTTPLPDLDYLRFLYQFGEDDSPLLGDDGLPIPRPNVRIVHGSSYDNAANLAPDFLSDTVRRYEGTTLGDQELRGIVALEVKDAIWRRAWIRRVEHVPAEAIRRTAILVDPAVTKRRKGHKGHKPETGIVVMSGLRNGDLALLDDASGDYTEGQWSDLVVALALAHDADVIAAEDNQGGELVEAAIRRAIERAAKSGTAEGKRLARAGRQAKVQRVHATQDKAARAGMVVGMWEHGHVWHVGNPRRFVRAEHQLCTFDPTKAHDRQGTDRMDAIVWGALLLAGDGTDRAPLRALSNAQAWAKIAERLRRGGAR